MPWHRLVTDATCMTVTLTCTCLHDGYCRAPPKDGPYAGVKMVAKMVKADCRP